MTKKSTDRLVEHPEVRVTLIGEDGNAFSILGRVRAAMREAGLSQSEIDRYTEAATSGDYDHLLRVTMDWVEVE